MFGLVQGDMFGLVGGGVLRTMKAMRVSTHSTGEFVALCARCGQGHDSNIYMYMCVYSHTHKGERAHTYTYTHKHTHIQGSMRHYAKRLRNTLQHPATHCNTL